MINFKEIDFSKYKRFFAFGCSFTAYDWPTWANILHKEMPTAEFYNFGHIGGGNSMISNRIAEANCRYKFNETDLIIPMWTTFCREDRWKHGSWLSVGNIYTQQVYDEKFVKEHCDPKGYLLRDLAIITLTSNYLDNLVSDSFTLASVPYHHQMDMNDNLQPTVNEILNVYTDTITITPPALIDLELRGNFQYGHKYIKSGETALFRDYHPHPLNYYNYLNKIGLPLTDKSKIYAEQSMKLLSKVKTQDDLHTTFDTMNSDRHEKLKSIF